MRYSILLLIVLVGFSSCQKDEKEDQLDAILVAQIKQYSSAGTIEGLILNDELSEIPADPRNELTPAKVALGKMLFHESIISNKAKKQENNFTYSCASCHHAQAGFQACVPQGIGEGGLGFGRIGESRLADLANYAPEELDVQPIRTPTALNVAFQDVMLWNGQFGATGTNAGTNSSWTPGTPKEKNLLGYQGVETQAIAGLDVHRMEVTEEVISQYPEYKTLFDQAFGEFIPENRYTNITAGLAIAAYERTLLATEAPFQKWLKGDDNAMTIDQKKGAILFFGQAQCFQCHDGPALNSTEFYSLGMADLDLPGVYSHGLDDNTERGRGGFTQRREDDYKFKVPQLYSIKYSPFYGHGSSFTSVRDILEYKNKALPENADVPQTSIDPNFKPLRLSKLELDQLEDFIVNGLDDANLMRYIPISLPSGNCFPNNDAQSQLDLGCR